VSNNERAEKLEDEVYNMHERVRCLEAAARAKAQDTS
jgi:hypothetical protein